MVQTALSPRTIVLGPEDLMALLASLADDEADFALRSESDEVKVLILPLVDLIVPCRSETNANERTASDERENSDLAIVQVSF